MVSSYTLDKELIERLKTHAYVATEYGKVKIPLSQLIAHIIREWLDNFEE